MTHKPPVVAMPLEGMHVLLVEDDDDAREMLALLLGMSGAYVVSTASACDALTTLESQSFQILVSDIGMPVTDGYALIREIRAHEVEHGGFLPAVAVTAYSSESDRLEALSAGFQSHRQKPIEIEELVTLMTTLAVAARCLKEYPSHAA